MKTRSWPALALLGGLVAFSSVSWAESKFAPKGRKVKVDGLTLTLPTEWKQKELPPRSLRKGEFEVPAAKGDKQAGEIAIFQFAGGGGGVGQNITRWLGQFQSRGRKLNLSKGTALQGEYYLADISGTYNQPVGAPFLRKTKPLPNAKMLGVILLDKKAMKVYYIKFTGPAATVSANAASYRTFFGGDMKSEKKAKVPGSDN